MDPTERTSLLQDRRRSTQKKQYNNTENGESLSIPLPSPYREQEPITFIPNQDNKNSNSKFNWFNKRTGYYDEDRQGLVKENTGVRVWSESYSSIGIVYK